MTYYMIITITILLGSGNSLAVEKVPADNYEHCMEIRQHVEDALNDQYGFGEVSVLCPPVQR